MSITLGAAAALGGMSTLGSIGGGLLSSSGSAKAVKRQIAWERERAQNAHQWEVEDLKKAGLNPILSAGGQGAVTGSIDTVNTNEGIAQGFNDAINNYISAKQLKMAEQKNKADIENQTALTNAQVDQANANTARTLALLPEEIETHRFNRSGRIRRELGQGASAKAIKMIENAGEKAGKWYGEKTTKHYKPKWKPQPIIFRDNKHSYMR